MTYPNNRNINYKELYEQSLEEISILKSNLKAHKLFISDCLAAPSPIANSEEKNSGNFDEHLLIIQQINKVRNFLSFIIFVGSHAPKRS